MKVKPGEKFKPGPIRSFSRAILFSPEKNPRQASRFLPPAGGSSRPDFVF